MRLLFLWDPTEIPCPFYHAKIHEPGRRSWPQHKPAGVLILDFPTPEMWGRNCCWWATSSALFCYGSLSGLKCTYSEVGTSPFSRGQVGSGLLAAGFLAPRISSFLCSTAFDVLSSHCFETFSLRVSHSLTLELLLNSSWMYVLSPQTISFMTVWATSNVFNFPTMHCKCLACRRYLMSNCESLSCL